MSRLRTVLFALLMVGLGLGIAQAGTYFNNPNLFAVAQYNSWTFGPDWKLVSTELQQSTGWIVVFYQNQVTGAIAAHVHRDTGLIACHDATTGIPLTCTSGAVVN